MAFHIPDHVRPALSRLRYVQPDGCIRFRACLAAARRERDSIKEMLPTFSPSIRERIEAWPRLKRVQHCMDYIRQLVAGEQGLFGDYQHYAEADFSDARDSFEQLAHERRRKNAQRVL